MSDVATYVVGEGAFPRIDAAWAAALLGASRRVLIRVREGEYTSQDALEIDVTGRELTIAAAVEGEGRALLCSPRAGSPAGTNLFYFKGDGARVTLRDLHLVGCTYLGGRDCEWTVERCDVDGAGEFGFFAVGEECARSRLSLVGSRVRNCGPGQNAVRFKAPAGSLRVELCEFSECGGPAVLAGEFDGCRAEVAGCRVVGCGAGVALVRPCAGRASGVALEGAGGGGGGAAVSFYASAADARAGASCGPFPDFLVEPAAPRTPSRSRFPGPVPPSEGGPSTVSSPPTSALRLDPTGYEFPRSLRPLSPPPIQSASSAPVPPAPAPPSSSSSSSSSRSLRTSSSFPTPARPPRLQEPASGSEDPGAAVPPDHEPRLEEYVVDPRGGPGRYRNITEAWAAASSAGAGRVSMRVLQGEYPCDRTLEIDVSGRELTIAGEGRALLRAPRPGSSELLCVRGDGARVTLRNLHLVGCTQFMGTGSEWTAENLLVDGAGDFGLFASEASSCSRLTILRCLIRGCGPYNGVTFMSPRGALRVEACEIGGCGSGVSAGEHEGCSAEIVGCHACGAAVAFVDPSDPAASDAAREPFPSFALLHNAFVEAGGGAPPPGLAPLKTGPPGYELWPEAEDVLGDPWGAPAYAPAPVYPGEALSAEDGYAEMPGPPPPPPVPVAVPVAVVPVAPWMHWPSYPAAPSEASADAVVSWIHSCAAHLAGYVTAVDSERAALKGSASELQRMRAEVEAAGRRGTTLCGGRARRRPRPLCESERRASQLRAGALQQRLAGSIEVDEGRLRELPAADLDALQQRLLDSLRRVGDAAAAAHRREAAAGASPAPPSCAVCLERPVRVVLQPCGHARLCEECAEKVETCPECRAPIASRIRAFL
eukprot:tig00021489_g21675.t1